MKIIVCLDDRNGMLFHGRRQSRDETVRQRILEYAKGTSLWMNQYSAGMFEKAGDSLRVCDDFLSQAGAGDCCFVEDQDITPYISQIEEIVVFRWGRTYPYDAVFPLELEGSRWRKISSDQFPGKSHQKILQEVYVL